MDFKKILNNLALIRYNKRGIITFGIVAALVIVGSLVYSLRYNIMFMSSGKAEPEKIYAFDATKQNSVYPYDDKLIVVNNESVMCLDKDGDKVFEVLAKTSTPIVKTAGDYILLADRGGSEVYVIHEGELINNFSAENKIINCSINERGRTVLITNETSYRNVIVAYNTRGEEIYRWKISEFYIIDAVLSYDGSRIAASYIATDNEQLTGGIIMVNVRQEKILGKLAYKDCVFPYVSFNGNNSATAIGDSMMVGITKTGDEDWAVNYDGKKLQTFAFLEGEGTVLAFENNSNNSTLVAYDDNGKERGSSRLDFSVNNLDMRSGLTLATGSTTAVAVDRKCRKRMETEFKHEVKRGWLKNNKSVIYIMNGSNIEVVKL